MSIPALGQKPGNLGTRTGFCGCWGSIGLEVPRNSLEVREFAIGYPRDLACNKLCYNMLIAIDRALFCSGVSDGGSL